MYEELLNGIASLNEPEEGFCSMDNFLNEGRAKLSSLDQLSSFFRIGNDTLVHKADKDLWKISESSAGDVIIERLFDPASNNPLRI